MYESLIGVNRRSKWGWGGARVVPVYLIRARCLSAPSRHAVAAGGGESGGALSNGALNVHF